MDALSLGQIGAFVVILAAAILTPGPAIVACARSAASRGLHPSLPYSFGLAVGAALWCLAALFGLTLLFKLVPQLFIALKLGGGLYLCYVAWQIWLHAKEPVGASARLGKKDGFLQGLALNLANPKPALFYAAVLISIFPDLKGFLPSLVVFFIALTVEVGFYLGVTALLSNGPVRRGYFSSKTLIDRISAALIGVLGLLLIFRP